MQAVQIELSGCKLERPVEYMTVFCGNEQCEIDTYFNCWGLLTWPKWWAFKTIELLFVTSWLTSVKFCFGMNSNNPVSLWLLFPRAQMFNHFGFPFSKIMRNTLRARERSPLTLPASLVANSSIEQLSITSTNITDLPSNLLQGCSGRNWSGSPTPDSWQLGGTRLVGRIKRTKMSDLLLSRFESAADSRR